MKKLWLTLILALLVVIGVACSNSEDSMKGHDMSEMKEEDMNNHDMSNMDNTNKGEESKKRKIPFYSNNTSKDRKGIRSNS